MAGARTSSWQNSSALRTGQHHTPSRAGKVAIVRLKRAYLSFQKASSGGSAHLASTGLYNSALWVMPKVVTVRPHRVAKSVECGGHESEALSQPKGRLREHNDRRGSDSSQELYPSNQPKGFGQTGKVKKTKDITDASYG